MTGRSWLMLIAGVIVLALPSSCAVLNYNRVCIARAERMGDEQMIRIAVEKLLQGMRPADATYVERNGQLVRIESPHTVVAYADVDAFLRANPDCCRIQTELEALGRRAALEDRITGRLAGYVILHYREHPDHADLKHAYVAVTNCGEAWSGI